MSEPDLHLMDDGRSRLEVDIALGACFTPSSPLDAVG